ncbi:peroxiredoxin-like family protein [Glaciihabitans sp. UYNi722]|uniref:peroxiredoxin-like family protein n=1 Tax=Glaciihabitans sp. UYNi722 TaxID=3156344 RepID=UPI003396C5F9
MSTTSPIADQVADMTSASTPSPVGEAFARARQAKVDAGHGVLADVGSLFPDADLLTENGSATTFGNEVDGRAAVVIFYRGAWCPYCNVALRTYNAELAGPLAARGIALVAVSPETPDGSKAMKDSNELAFTVLSDPGNQLGRALGIVNVATPAELSTNEQIGFDLGKANADGTTDLLFPTAAVVDAGGVLRFLDVHLDYTTRTEPGDILAAVDQLLP